MIPTPKRDPIGFAHRGARREYRDNTLASFTRARELGARGLETDAWLSADGVVVLDHDGQLRHGVRRQPLRALSSAALPPHIPHLEDVYERCGTAFELSIDVKDPDAAGPVLEVARRAAATSKLWLCSDDLAALRHWRDLDDDAHLVHSTGLRALTGASHPHRLPEEAVTGLLAGHARRMRREGVEALNLHQLSWTEDGVVAVHGEGTAAFGWDAQTAEALRRLVVGGIDGLYSDDVELMVSVIAGAARSEEP